MKGKRGLTIFVGTLLVVSLYEFSRPDQAVDALQGGSVVQQKGIGTESIQNLDNRSVSAVNACNLERAAYMAESSLNENQRMTLQALSTDAQSDRWGAGGFSVYFSIYTLILSNNLIIHKH
jgi:hypothetical protein